MTIEVKVPAFPESVVDGTLVTWHKKPGDAVRRDENLVDIETDKVVFEVPAPGNGVLEEVLAEEGATVVSGQMLARINTTADAGKQVRKRSTVAATSQADTSGTADKEAPAAPPAEPIITPSARKLIREHKLETTGISATGKGGRILKEDVLRYLQQLQQGSAPSPDTPATAPAEPPAKVAQQAPAMGTTAGGRPERRVPMTRLRARIAERLVEAQQNAAILTTFNEVNMQPVMELRNKYKEKFETEYGVRLGFMSFFVKASIEALKRFPELNASIDGHDIVYHGFFDIGIAVSSPRGLVVPILRDADQMGMAEIETRIIQYAQMAKSGALTMEDITGGTFTITNGGVFGSLLSTPIINPPQSGILGMHKIQERPMAENGAVVIRPMMNLALSYDHRIVDGQGAVQFLVTIKELLEDPARIMLEV